MNANQKQGMLGSRAIIFGVKMSSSDFVQMYSISFVLRQLITISQFLLAILQEVISTFSVLMSKVFAVDTLSSLCPTGLVAVIQSSKDDE